MEYLVKPWAHQLEAIERAKDLPGFALFFDPGTGKTGTTINILRYKFNQHRRVLRTLILAPPVVLLNWKNEWSKHSKIDPALVTPLLGSGKQRYRTFTELAFKESCTQGHVFITNYESLLMKDVYEAFRAWVPDVVVFDESHRCKSPTSKRSKLADKLVNGEFTKKGQRLTAPVPHRYLLSGSPVLNSPMDLFQQFLLLDGGQTFGRNFFGFRARYFVDKNAGMPKQKYFPKWEIRQGALEEISQVISAVSQRVEQKDCLDLPPLIRVPIRVGMTPEQARVYREMKRDLVSYLGDKEAVATMALTKALRLQQIASGYVKTSDGQEESFGETPKMAALRELLEELTPTGKVIVWAVFKENYTQIKNVCESLGLGFAEVHGDISQRQQQENLKRFCSDPATQVFIGHPASAGEGINIVEARYSIWFSRNFSLAFEIQATARNYRGGSEIHDRITRYDLITDGTIDEMILEKLAGKQKISMELLREAGGSL